MDSVMLILCFKYEVVDFTFLCFVTNQGTDLLNKCFTNDARQTYVLYDGLHILAHFLQADVIQRKPLGYYFVSITSCA